MKPIFKTDHLIGPDRGSAFFNGDVICKSVTRIFMSFGGGMGGGNKTYYATEVVPVKGTNEIKIKNYDGRELTLNSRFIVESEPKKLVHLPMDISRNMNYEEKRFKKYIAHKFVIIGAKDTYTLTNESINWGKNSSFIDIDTVIESEKY